MGVIVTWCIWVCLVIINEQLGIFIECAGMLHRCGVFMLLPMHTRYHAGWFLSLTIYGRLLCLALCSL
jgi:hypothetical protein